MYVGRLDWLDWSTAGLHGFQKELTVALDTVILVDMLHGLMKSWWLLATFNWIAPEQPLQPWIPEGPQVYRRAEGDEAGEQIPRGLQVDNKERRTNAGQSHF